MTSQDGVGEPVVAVSRRRNPSNMYGGQCHPQRERTTAPTRRGARPVTAGVAFSSRADLMNNVG
eukprot:11172980-Prorocentrum_lima.AAC.1